MDRASLSGIVLCCNKINTLVRKLPISEESTYQTFLMSHPTKLLSGLAMKHFAAKTSFNGHSTEPTGYTNAYFLSSVQEIHWFIVLIVFS